VDSLYLVEIRLTSWDQRELSTVMVARLTSSRLASASDLR
jgi:hypothetical protein